MTKIELSPHFERFVKEQVANGHFASETEVLEAALARMEAEEAETDRWMAEMSPQERAEFDESIATAIAEADAGLGRPAEAVFDELEARYRAMAEAEDAKSRR
jgi:antitoxin ParD1/3/4